MVEIATLSDWLKDFNQCEAKPKPKPIAQYTRHFSRASSELQVIARNCDWFISMFAPVVISGVIALVLVFRQSFENRSTLEWQRMIRQSGDYG